MLHLVTSADASYLARAVCLFGSFQAQHSVGRFWLFARDPRAVTVMHRLKMPGLTLVTLEEYDTPALCSVRQRRSALEYACSAKPLFLQHVMARIAEGDWVIWIDGDMGFFQPAERILPTGPADVLLTPHRFTAAYADLEPTVGTYNAGLVGFRKTPAGQAALAWWAGRCREWCGAVPEPGRYADQKYLEELPERFAGAVEAGPLGVNAGPWNAIERPVRAAGGTVFIADAPLVLYHFQGLRMLHRRWCDLYADDRIRVPPALRRLVYRPYVAALQRVRQALADLPDGNPSWAFLRVAKRLLLRQGNLVFV
jgi:hypothetical protein